MICTVCGPVREDLMIVRAGVNNDDRDGAPEWNTHRHESTIVLIVYRLGMVDKLRLCRNRLNCACGNSLWEMFYATLRGDAWQTVPWPSCRPANYAGCEVGSNGGAESNDLRRERDISVATRTAIAGMIGARMRASVQ